MLVRMILVLCALFLAGCSETERGRGGAAGDAALREEVARLRAENADLKQQANVLRSENQNLRRQLMEKGRGGTATVTTPVEATPGEYWLTRGSRKRHNSGCRYYRQSKGRPCGKDEGVPCKACGG